MKILNEMLHGLTGAERIMIMALTLLVIVAIVAATAMMLYFFRHEIRDSLRYKAIRFAFWCEDAADRFNKWNTLREDNADFTSISDWADYRRWKATQVPLWYQVVGAMLGVKN